MLTAYLMTNVNKPTTASIAQYFILYNNSDHKTVL